MFIVGLVVGPALGLLGGEQLLRAAAGHVFRVWLAAGLVLVAILFAPVLTLELKIGLLVGLALGFALAATPLNVPPTGMSPD